MKKNSIRFFALLCTAIILFTNCVSPALAADNQLVPYAVEGGNIYFDPETGTIEACDTSVTKAVIPEKINNVAVTSIGYNAFSFCYALTSVTIPDSVTSIGDGAFYLCSDLTSVTIPDGVTSIGSGTFSFCYALTSVAIPDSVTSIGDSAFLGCNVLTNIKIPDNVTYIGSSAFSGCENLTSLTLPNGITEICRESFSKCSSLTSITIPDGVTSIGYAAFSYCFGLASVTIPDSVTEIGSHAFDSTDLTSVTIPSGVTSIGDSAFSNCNELTSVTIPVSVTYIGDNVFIYCNSFNDIYYAGSKEDWGNIVFGINYTPINANIHYNSTGPDDKPEEQPGDKTEEQNPGDSGGVEQKYGEFLCDGETIMLFGKKPSAYDSKMAQFAVTLSQKTYEGAASIEGFVREKGYEKVYSNNYGGSLAFTVATKPYYRSDDGEQTDILLIAAQGSTNIYELFNDATALASTQYKGYYVYDIVRDFRNAIVEGLPKVTEPNRSYKVLVTGHSLGGAAANLVAAQLTDENISGVKIQKPKSDVFCYTFGAINSINKDTPVQSGYENIHNVYNEKDTFSPKLYGGWLPTGMGRGFGKFGHMDLFSWDYRTDADRAKWDVTQIIDAINHAIAHYVDVVSGNDPHVDISRCYSTCLNHNTYRYSLVGCPTDVDVYCEGELVGRVKNNVVDTSVTTIEIIVEDDGKYIIYPDDRQYDLHITAFDDGRMLFLTQDTSNGDPTLRVIAGVELTPGKELCSEVGGAVETPDVKLYVVDDSGTPMLEVREDGTEVPVEPAIRFTDVADDAYYADAVKWAVAHRVTNGTTSSTFSPDKVCTRAQIVTFLWRAYGSPEPKSTAHPFADVMPSDYFYKPVLWAAENHITSGTGAATFSPNAPCTRAQAVTFQYRAAKEPPTSGSSSFSDVSAGTWYSDAVGWAVEQGITNGTGAATFSPNHSCSRAQIVTFLFRQMTKQPI